jgi:hypothetical protein
MDMTLYKCAIIYVNSKDPILRNSTQTSPVQDCPAHTSRSDQVGNLVAVGTPAGNHRCYEGGGGLDPRMCASYGLTLFTSQFLTNRLVITAKAYIGALTELEAPTCKSTHRILGTCDWTDIGTSWPGKLKAFAD